MSDISSLPISTQWTLESSAVLPSKVLLSVALVFTTATGQKGTLREHATLRDLPSKTDLEAILAALRPRVSCNRDLGIFNDSVNQGIGLTTTGFWMRDSPCSALQMPGRPALVLQRR